MEVNWIIIAVILVCVIVLFIFLIIQNQKDKKDTFKFFIDEEKNNSAHDNDKI